MRGNSNASSMDMPPTSTRHDPIKGYISRFPTLLEHLVPRRKQEARWLPFQSWPDCTMTTERWPKAEKTESSRRSRVEKFQEDLLFWMCRASLSPCCQKASVSTMRRISSLKEREEHVLLVSPSSSAPREKRDWGGESGHFSNGCPR